MLYEALIYAITYNLYTKMYVADRIQLSALCCMSFAFWCTFDYMVDLNVCSGFCLIGPFLKI